MNAITEIVNTIKSCPNVEATRSPYWLILDPRQNMSCDIYELAGQITGPFFSREDAQLHLESKRYRFSKRAKVFCHSGTYSYKYEQLWDEIESKKGKLR